MTWAAHLYDRDEYTYFIQAEGGGPIKIGMSSNPAERLASVQVGHPLRLRLLDVWDGNHERQLHERFADARLQGEWFTDTAELLELIVGTHEDREVVRDAITRSLAA